MGSLACRPRCGSSAATWASASEWYTCLPARLRRNSRSLRGVRRRCEMVLKAFSVALGEARSRAVLTRREALSRAIGARCPRAREGAAARSMTRGRGDERRYAPLCAARGGNRRARRQARVPGSCTMVGIRSRGARAVDAPGRNPRAPATQTRQSLKISTGAGAGRGAPCFVRPAARRLLDQGPIRQRSASALRADLRAEIAHIHDTDRQRRQRLDQEEPLPAAQAPRAPSMNCQDRPGERRSSALRQGESR